MRGHADRVALTTTNRDVMNVFVRIVAKPRGISHLAVRANILAGLFEFLLIHGAHTHEHTIAVSQSMANATSHTGNLTVNNSKTQTAVTASPPSPPAESPSA